MLSWGDCILFGRDQKFFSDPENFSFHSSELVVNSCRDNDGFADIVFRIMFDFQNSCHVHIASLPS